MKIVNKRSNVAPKIEKKYWSKRIIVKLDSTIGLCTIYSPGLSKITSLKKRIKKLVIGYLKCKKELFETNNFKIKILWAYEIRIIAPRIRDITITLRKNNGIPIKMEIVPKTPLIR